MPFANSRRSLTKKRRSFFTKRRSWMAFRFFRCFHSACPRPSCRGSSAFFGFREDHIGRGIGNAGASLQDRRGQAEREQRKKTNATHDRRFVKQHLPFFLSQRR